MAARLKEMYKNEVAPQLMKKFNYKSVMEIPKLDKIVINVTSGEIKDNSKILDSIISDLKQITGQTPVVCKAKKSVANFKIREGMKSLLPDTTKIIIAQRINSIQHADKIVVLDDGRIDDIGTHEELLQRNEKSIIPNYCALCATFGLMRASNKQRQ